VSRKEGTKGTKKKREVPCLVKQGESAVKQPLRRRKETTGGGEKRGGPRSRRRATLPAAIEGGEFTFPEDGR